MSCHTFGGCIVKETKNQLLSANFDELSRSVILSYLANEERAMTCFSCGCEGLHVACALSNPVKRNVCSECHESRRVWAKSEIGACGSEEEWMKALTETEYKINFKKKVINSKKFRDKYWEGDAYDTKKIGNSTLMLSRHGDGLCSIGAGVSKDMMATYGDRREIRQNNGQILKFEKVWSSSAEYIESRFGVGLVDCKMVHANGSITSGMCIDVSKIILVMISKYELSYDDALLWAKAMRKWY